MRLQNIVLCRFPLASDHALACTNTFLAVALNEPEKPWLVKTTQAQELAAPAILPYELGNALSSLVRRKRLSGEQAMATSLVVRRIPVELVEMDIEAALGLSIRFGIYCFVTPVN